MKNRGSILILVLWGITLLSFLAAGGRTQVWTEAKAARMQLDRVGEKSNEAELIGRIKLFLEENSQDEIDPPDFFIVETEEGRINLNKAPLKALLEVPGMIPEAAASILDWRDPDSQTSPGGAEEDFYRSLPVPYSCKNGKIESFAELRMIKGVTPEVYEEISSSITLFGEGADCFRVKVPSRFEIILKKGASAKEWHLQSFERL